MKDTTAISLVFPHQLYKTHPALEPHRPVWMIEEWLYFSQYRFHQQKLVLHRASMRAYQAQLQHKGYQVNYVEATNPGHDIRLLVARLAKDQVKEIHYADVVDDWLETRLRQACNKYHLTLVQYETPNYLNRLTEAADYFRQKKGYFQTDFYIAQRKQRNLLLLANGQPEGGKWSFDADNRLKLPKNEPLPAYPFPQNDPYVQEARQYVAKHFTSNYGEAVSLTAGNSFYPVTHEQAAQWLADFLQQRFAKFGPYEDAIVQKEHFLYHSLLTPALNIGLLQPGQVIEEVLKAAAKYQVPLSSTEGFIRQVMGWREYIRILYQLEGRRQRTENFWGFTRTIPGSFRTGQTGIVPVDETIRKLLRTGYSHHIERLMIMGNFMLLCEFHPDEVYRWFMEMYIDAYDWVMVPNVYGMTQFADGGLMMTKPYISGSNYILKMSDYKKGPWQQVWDGLFWRFMHVHRNVMARNHRMGMLIKTFDKMPEAKKAAHLYHAEQFLSALSNT